MTVRFVKSWNGYYEGQIVTSPNGGQSEATLIALGYAVADLDGPDNSPVPVFAQTNPLTGVIKTTAGGIILPSKGPIKDRVSDLAQWLVPANLPVLDPAQFIGMSTLTSGALSATHVPGGGDFSRGALRVAASGVATNTAITFSTPAATEPGLSAVPAKASGALNMRIKCSDWSRVTRMYIALSADNFVTSYIWNVTDGGVSRYGLKDVAYASAWNDNFRTISCTSANMIKNGSPANWGTGYRYFDFTSVRVTLTTTDVVTIDIDRIYSPDWPAGVFVPIFDGAYKTARDLFYAEFLPRGWGAGFSSNVLAQGSFYPEVADLVALSKSGGDVFCHGHHVLGDGSVQPLTDSVSEAQYLLRLSQQRRALLASGVHPSGMVWHQFLQNTGRYTGNADMAGLLRSQGVRACRTQASDATWGVNPFYTAATSAVAAADYETWLPYKGPYNYRGAEMGENITQGGSYHEGGVIPTNPTLKKRIEYACLTGAPLVAFNHNFIDPAGIYDTSASFGVELVSALVEKEAKGQLFVISPVDLLRLTLERTGDFYMRPDGEWAYRQDPSKIAF